MFDKSILNKTPNELLAAFYKTYNLGDDGGNSSSYVKVEFTKKIYFYFPNFDARRKVVLKHDIHHIVTGYKSIMKGETEISAWEIGSGCTNYLVAYLINSQALVMGIPMLNIKGIFNAFIKGRRTKNLYKDDFPDQQIANMTIEEIRKFLKLTEFENVKIKPTFADYFTFIIHILIALFVSIFSLLILPLLLIYTIYILLFSDNKNLIPKPKS
jgi:hypothetical protein